MRDVTGATERRFRHMALFRAALISCLFKFFKFCLRIGFQMRLSLQARGLKTMKQTQTCIFRAKNSTKTAKQTNLQTELNRKDNFKNSKIHIKDKKRTEVIQQHLTQLRFHLKLFYTVAHQSCLSLHTKTACIVLYRAIAEYSPPRQY